VTGGGVSGSDMPSFPWTARQDASLVEDASLAALLAGDGLPAGADPQLRPVADVLAALTARPAGDELTGLAGARAEFRRHGVMPVQGRHSARRRPRGLASRLSVKAAATAAFVVMALGGAAAAYAGVLPGSWQQFAHRTIGAPMHVTGRETAAGAGATGTAARQPCAAYQRALAHGSASQQAAALRNLVKAAGGPGKVTAWCAAVPGSSLPAQGPRFSGPLAGRGVPRHAWSPHHAGWPAVWPFGHHGRPTDPAGTHIAPRPGVTGRTGSLPLPGG
jgi:hypothetical protein